MRASSLALRLFFSAATWTVVMLVVAGIVLSSLNRDAAERACDRRLNVYLRTLVADVATPDEAGERFPQSLGEPLFELPLSGWYWQVTRQDTARPEVRSSRSLWDSTLPHLDDASSAATAAGARQGYVHGPEDQMLRLVERTIDLGDEGRFGVAPLKRISAGLAAIRSGAAERLEGSFPIEVAALARDTNALIEANREIVTRARTHVGNLAHALKTPLSVMMNEATANPENALASKIREQTDIMRDQVTHHLERARLAARVAVVGTVTEVRPVVSALVRMMEKIHHDRGISIMLDAPEDARFRGERQDLEEMVGNLVDNACKWAQSRVALETFVERPEVYSERRIVRIIVDDDGPGLSPQQREQVGRRGRRLDEAKPGTGLGLSIVVELANLYGGGLTLGTAPIGGLRAELVLPGA